MTEFPKAPLNQQEVALQAGIIRGNYEYAFTQKEKAEQKSRVANGISNLLDKEIRAVTSDEKNRDKTVIGTIYENARIMGMDEEIVAKAEQASGESKQAYANESQVKKHMKAELWDANQHYQANKANYEQIALEDAQTQGYDIQFGGQHYPAQTPEAPKEPQHQ